MVQADIAIIGLGVMGENLALNIADKGFTVVVYNRTVEKVNAFLSGRASETTIMGARSIEELPKMLKRPRKIILMVKAGKPVDDLIGQIVPLLSRGDIIIDGGNSHYADTTRRTQFVESKGFLYVGAGISGGEEGALLGPSIMPGGSSVAWPHVKHILQAAAAKVGHGVPCCEWVGPDGAGHFVKMVHNGIEYGDMQLICESYHLMRELLNMTTDQMYRVFKRWNNGELESYLIEITSNIFAVKDADGSPLIDKILDVAEQKGTGTWTSISALEHRVPLPLITEAVFARALSTSKDERLSASELIQPRTEKFCGSRSEFLKDIRAALYAAKIVCYAQGFALMRALSAALGWNLNYGNIALLWRGGCIIRSVFLDKIKAAFDRNPMLPNLMLDPFFKRILTRSQANLRNVCSNAMLCGIPVPAFASALCYFDGYRSPWLPANLLQAQRDYFGAHTYERIDKPRGQFFHTKWIRHGESTASSRSSV